MAAFFADIKEGGVGKRRPNLSLPTPEQEAKLKELRAAIAEGAIDKVLRRDADLEIKVIEGQAKWATATKETLAGDDEEAKKALKLPGNIKTALQVAPDKRNNSQQAALNNHYRATAPELTEYRKRLGELQNEAKAVEGSIRKMLITEVMATPRETRILPRGNWLDDSGPIVQPAVPGYLAHENKSDRRANRLDLANWIVASDNPLTARAFVNRLWMLFHGQGLSKDVQDLGAQGVPPTHPELLDWLAAEFVNSGWNVKHMVKLLVSSHTYRQVSTDTPDLREKDANNRWFARQGRWRLDAELVRDTALHVAGMLAEDLGGESVKPYQPAGYWAQLNFPKRKWHADKDSVSRYRRGIYTFWCRSFPHPAMLAFDAPSREECSAKRARSNTPQQALVLLNDPVFVEAARVFGQRLVNISDDPKELIERGYALALSRQPSPSELQILTTLYHEKLRRYQQDPEAAKQLATAGDWPAATAENFAKTAACTEITRAILNLYETTSRY